MNSAAIDIIQTLRERQHQAYLAGGCVRDLILGREPADYDVATDATPDEVMRIFPQTYAVGAQFGVVLVPYKNERGSGSVEVATFRSDGAYSDGRHPDEVRFSKTPAEDAQRRDFTINGMMLDPLNGNQVLDYVHGRDDLRAGVIRTIGDPNRRFGEDKLRMLRAVRFAARFGYEIAPETLRAIQDHAAEIHQVSRERVRDELTKMLTEGKARRAFELLNETGLLHEVLPEIEVTKGVEQPPQFHPEGDVWMHTLILLEGLEPNSSPTLAWGALLHDVGKPPTFRRAPDRIRFDNHADIGSKMAEAICHRLRMSNDETEQIVAIVANHMKFPEMPKMRESTLKRFLRQPKFEEHLAMHRLDCLASHGDLALYDFAKEKLASTPPEQIRPQPLLTGHDLIAAGYSAGPRFKQMLSEVEDGQLEGRLATKEEALEFVLQRFGAPGCV
ncbi:MAG: metal dependent phosphohydrolase [Acidobacteriaceae bacterium]|nr:metal dependent phosphohydrolase [Acidobacteriaceae bacterium]